MQQCAKASDNLRPSSMTRERRETKNPARCGSCQNARVHKYSSDGKLLFSLGEPERPPGQFNLARNIACHDGGWVYVADRENHRVQVFDSNGKYQRPPPVAGSRTPRGCRSRSRGLVESRPDAQREEKGKFIE
jgi:hypothetical protein